MSWLLANPWIAVVVPALIALGIVLAGRVGRSVGPWVGMLGPVLVILVGALSLIRVGGTEPEEVPWRSMLASSGGYEWLAGLRVGWAVDSVAALMLLVVGLVALMVMIFSHGYMHGDKGWSRYFALLSLFTASMTLLVIADGFAGLFIGWELVGACSYLLVGFWFEKPSARDAAVKAFITTRIGDVGLMVGLALLWSAGGTLTYTPLLAQLGVLPVATVTAAAALIAIGAIGKSAQFPLHVWLPDAMEGPTPVSALIHAATMVAAGVYLVVRVWPLFEAAPEAKLVLLAAGLISSMLAASSAIAQTDVKKVLAYSTISQLGFMFVALGVGAWTAAFFHLITHAMFKALLFLGSGSLIHGTGTQDLREMGGLRKSMPVTYWTWLVGAAALVGLVPFAGFFSKDEILAAALHSSPALGLALLVTAATTAFYVARATRLAFLDGYRGSGHPHEGRWTMTLPLLVLAVPSALLGLALYLDHRLPSLLAVEPEPMLLWLAGFALLLTLGGLGAGWWVARGGAAGDEAFEESLGGLWPVLRSAWGWDRLVSVHFVAVILALVRVTWAFVDRWLIDGAVEGLASLTRRGGNALAAVQSGNAQFYVALIAAGVVVLFVGQRYPIAYGVGFAAVIVAAAVTAVRSR